LTYVEPGPVEHYFKEMAKGEDHAEETVSEVQSDCREG
jgi:hypothetical protein